MDSYTGLPIVGMVGGGQLARMTHQAAIALGQSLHVLAAGENDSAGLVAGRVVMGSHTDVDALTAFAADVDVQTRHRSRQLDLDGFPGDALQHRLEIVDDLAQVGERRRACLLFCVRIKLPHQPGRTGHIGQQLLAMLPCRGAGRSSRLRRCRWGS